MSSFIEIIPLLDAFFSGGNVFVIAYVLITGIQKKALFNIIIAITLFTFLLEFIFSFLHVSSDFDINLNFYAIGILILFSYSHFLIYRKVTLKFISILVLSVVIQLIFLIRIETIFHEKELTIVVLNSAISILILVLTLFNLRVYQKKLKNCYSSVKQKNLYGLRLIVFLLLFFNILWLIDDTTFLLIGENSVSDVLAILSLFYSYFSVLFLSIYAIKNQYVLDEIKKASKEIKELIVKEKNLQTLQNKELFEKLKQLLLKEKLYLNPDLSLNYLSKKLDSKDKIISHNIHHFSNTNFYSFINQYRIEHFKKLIFDDKNIKMSIDGIIELCGFKSKSTFYSHFRKIENTTPLEFIKKLKY
ncbi:MAG: helix-turn-helix domain-containing protein [Flavobacteriaceae bacterium]|nr:MAG: helix-turn-helix domain-containing protein [Flavobacteriaceae bacterium]